MEGPSLVILKESLKSFKGKKIVAAYGTTTRIDPSELIGQKIMDFKTKRRSFFCECCQVLYIKE